MGAGIPLPALEIKPPADPVEAMGKMMQLKSLMQQQSLFPGQQKLQEGQIQGQQMENQQRQLQLQDQQKMSKIMTDPSIDWTDPKSFTAMLNKAGQAGVTPQTLMTIRNSNMEYMQKFTAQQKDKQEIDIKNHDEIRGGLLALVNDPKFDPQNPDTQKGFAGLVQKAQAYGFIPQGQIPQQVPDKASLTAMANSMALGSVQMKEASEATAANARETAARFKNVNGMLYDVSGPTPVPALTQQMKPDDYGKLVDSIVPPTGANTALNMRTKAQVDFYLRQNNLEAANKAITEAGNQIGAIEKETNPQVLGARVNTAVATEVGKAKALAPELAQITKTTSSGMRYINGEDAPGESGKFVRKQAAEAGVPVVDKDTAGLLSDIDTARANQKYMLDTIGGKLAKDATGRLYSGPANTIEKLSQSDPQLAAMGTYRNAAIQTLRAVAGSRGLRINKSEIEMAVQNDIPKPSDTLPTAQAKIKNLGTFLDNTERAHLVQNRQANTQPPATGTAGGSIPPNPYRR